MCIIHGINRCSIMVAELISCFFGALFYYNTQFTLCCWEAPPWRLYAKAHTSLPVNIPLPQRKPRSGEGCHTLELKSKWPDRKCFSIISREVHALHSGRSLTANESSNEPLCKTMDVCELPSTQRACSSFPHTSEEPQPLANTRKISTRLTKSQPYPNKPENVHF